MNNSQSSYHFLQKPFFVLQEDLYRNPHASDVIFVSKQNCEVKAHKIMLLGVSSFLKDIFESYKLDSYKILLPNFSTDIIQSFVQFFYTGEICIGESKVEEFISLCYELKSEEIPVISELIKNHKLVNDVSTTSVKIAIDESTEDFPLTDVMEEPKEEIEFDEEYFESNENVETIFFDENECSDTEFIERQVAAASEPKVNEEEKPGIKEEYLSVQYIQDIPQFVLIEENEKTKHVETTETNEQKPDELAMGNTNLDEIFKSGMRFWRKCGVAKNSMKRLDKSDKQERKQPNNVPSIFFPTLPMNLNQLREEQNRFKKRLQEAINSCRDSGNSVKKASKMFGVPKNAIERNLRGFKNLSP